MPAGPARMVEGFGSLYRAGMPMSKSSPSLAASFSLRDFCQSRHRLPMEKSSSHADIVLEEIDRLGGNGRWRQRKADEFFKKRQLEELERLRQQRAMEEDRRRRRQEFEAKKKRQQQEEEQKRQAERDRQRREHEEREEKVRREQERERQRREEEEREWLARQPRTCEACGGSGVCVGCGGKGQLFSLFLVTQVEKGAHMEFGRQPQGCEECGGCKQNIMGELVAGSGQCSSCNGRGKVWPKAAFESKASRARLKTLTTRVEIAVDKDPGSPVSSMGSPKAQGFGV